MKTRIVTSIFFLFLIMVSSMLFGGSTYLQTQEISRQRLQFFPVPTDFRNYFFLQSIGDNTSIIIGDFTGREPLITHIFDKNSDNTIDLIEDYYIESKKLKTPKKSISQFYQDDVKKFKEDIIGGSIFRNNYAYKMKSLKLLRQIIDEGANIVKHDYGYKVIYYDVDKPTTTKSEFYFAKKDGKYDMMFRTFYYTLFNAQISTPLEYSVYCKETRDPVVASTVDELLKYIKGKKVL